MRKWMVQIFFTIVMISEICLSGNAQAHPVCNTSKMEGSMKKIGFVSDHPDSPMNPIGIYVSKHKSYITFRTLPDNKSDPAIFIRKGTGYLITPYHVCGKTAIIDRKIDTGQIALWVGHSPIEIMLLLDESARKVSKRRPKG